MGNASRLGRRPLGPWPGHPHRSRLTCPPFRTDGRLSVTLTISDIDDLLRASAACRSLRLADAALTRRLREFDRKRDWLAHGGRRISSIVLRPDRQSKEVVLGNNVGRG